MNIYFIIKHCRKPVFLLLIFLFQINFFIFHHLSFMYFHQTSAAESFPLKVCSTRLRFSSLDYGCSPMLRVGFPLEGHSISRGSRGSPVTASAGFTVHQLCFPVKLLVFGGDGTEYKNCHLLSL